MRERKNKGDNEDAIEYYTKAIEINENWGIFDDLPTADNNRGVAYFDTGDTDKAIDDYTKAIELKSDRATAYYNRGVAYAKKFVPNSPRPLIPGVSGSSWDKQEAIKQEAIANFQKAADLYKQKEDTANYHKALDEIEKLENK